MNKTIGHDDGGAVGEYLANDAPRARRTRKTRSHGQRASAPGWEPGTDLEHGTHSLDPSGNEPGDLPSDNELCAS